MTLLTRLELFNGWAAQYAEWLGRRDDVRC